MINHSFDSSAIHHELDESGNVALYYGDPTESSAVSHLAPIEAGDEICFSYGNFGNEKLLLVYGFTAPDNPFDAVSLYAPVSVADPMYDSKVRILEALCGVTDVNAAHVLKLPLGEDHSSVIPESLLSVLRVIGLQSPEDILSLAVQRAESKVDDNDPGDISRVSLENERGALTALQDALYTMSRRLALNLISETGLHGASATAAAQLLGGPSAGTVTQAPEARLASDQQGVAEIHGESDAVNLENAKILCQSECKKSPCFLESSSTCYSFSSLPLFP
jgi:hypothetical protein